MKKITLLLAATVIIFSVYAQTNSQPGCYPFPKTISVNGSAEMDIIPDEIFVQVDLREYKKKGEDKTDLDKIKTEFLASCKAAGIADSNISVASYDGYNMANLWRRKRKDPELLSSIASVLRRHRTVKLQNTVNNLKLWQLRLLKRRQFI